MKRVRLAILGTMSGVVRVAFPVLNIPVPSPRKSCLPRQALRRREEDNIGNCFDFSGTTVSGTVLHHTRWYLITSVVVF